MRLFAEKGVPETAVVPARVHCNSSKNRRSEPHGFDLSSSVLTATNELVRLEFTPMRKNVYETSKIRFAMVCDCCPIRRLWSVRFRILPSSEWRGLLERIGVLRCNLRHSRSRGDPQSQGATSDEVDGGFDSCGLLGGECIDSSSLDGLHGIVSRRERLGNLF